MGFKGERVGRFVLDRKIATVLEGEIWKARDETAGAPAGPYAIKLFYDPDWAAAFRACELPRTVDHPNVCRVADGATAGATTPWIAQEYLEGTTLRDLIAQQKYLPLAGAIPAAIQIVRGLGALHKAGIAHLDLRPRHILLDERGNLKLCEVTSESYRRAVLAKLFDKLHPLPKERADELHAYLPPEQKRGDVAGMASDMYALGTILYEMLTGERPAGFEVKLPSQRDKRIPKVFDEVILRALERSTRARSPSAVGLEQQLFEGISKVGFFLDLKADPVAWVKATPWRDAGQPLGEETGKFRLAFGKLARPKE